MIDIAKIVLFAMFYKFFFEALDNEIIKNESAIFL